MASYNTCDPHLRSWVPVAEKGDFPIQNLPLGIFETEGRGRRPGVAIGEFVLDLAEIGLLEGDTLNEFMARGAAARRALREKVSWLLHADNPELRDDGARRSRALLPAAEVDMRMAVDVGDYVDFYSSLEHATNVGRMFRPDNPLMANWKWLPVGYHGRCGTLALSGTDVRRPRGQVAEHPAGPPRLRASAKLDIELETGYFVGRNTSPGDTLDMESAREAIFGMVLLNDWSARDIQRWEYQPLGPFLGKSFLTSISPWIVTMEALRPFRVSGPPQDPEPLQHLHEPEPRGYDIHLEVLLQPAGALQPHKISLTSFRHMYWSMAQQLAHLTSNGASVRAGDLCGSGTVSGPERGSEGSLLELTRGGKEPLRLPGGELRTFLEDGDTAILRGWCEGPYRIGFGEVRGKVLPA